MAGNNAAQTTSIPAPGDPPVAALITIAAPDENGNVAITGANGATLPAAEVAAQNLFTGVTVYAYTGMMGNFQLQIPGVGYTPFWIGPAAAAAPSERNRPGLPNGGPGVILYAPSAAPAAASLPITTLVLDGELRDWVDYAAAQFNPDAYALLNTESLYIGARLIAPTRSVVVVEFASDNITYELTFNPALPQTALLRQTAPSPQELGTRAIAVVMNAAQSCLELRFARSALSPAITALTLKRIYIRAADGTAADTPILDVAVPIYDEIDGIIYPGGELTGATVTHFSVAGSLGQGAATWTADGRIERLNLNPGDTVTLELDARLHAPDLPEALVGLNLIGAVGLQPIDNGGLHTNNGWSNVLTASGLAIDNLRSGITALSTVTVSAAQTVRRGADLLAGFRFSLTLPPDLPAGLYVPTFQGYGQIGDGEIFAWEENGVFGSGDGLARQPLTRLPVVLTVGETPETRLLWALFYDNPSDGSRGILPEENRAYATLSNRVRFDSATYILPPGQYPIEPYLLNLLPNAPDVVIAPLLPLSLPGGTLQATITRPDGAVDTLPEIPILQNQLSQGDWGRQSPQSVYRLTTLDPTYTVYNFAASGEYIIQLTGYVVDVFGNRYSGGGTYRVLIADLLDLTPGVLPGAPFYVGDAFFAGGHIAPAVPAAVTIRVAVYPLDGSAMIEREFTGQANRDGYFALGGEPFRFDSPGEYVIDYEARYSGVGGRLWAASFRSAGVVANPNSNFVAHGTRGLPGLTGYPDLYRPAWFTLQQYPPPEMSLTVPPRLYTPYYSGDITIIPDGMDGGLQPILSAQDLTGVYRNWLLATLPDYVSPSGLSLRELALVDELPVGRGARLCAPCASYAYFSATRPDVTVRQFIMGQDDAALLTYWDNDDPLNGQIGAGADGLRPGDYVFLFGGLVLHNDAAGIQDTAVYAALALVGDRDEIAGIFPAYGAPLFSTRGETIYAFFHLTGVQPGQILTIGDTLSIAGQVAPTLPSIVSVSLTSPSGTMRQFSGFTSPTGYYYDPANDFTVNEIGVWTAQITVTPAGLPANGRLESPLPTGGIPGATDGRFSIYVAPEAALPPTWALPTGAEEITFRSNTAYNLTVLMPEGWANPQAFYTVRTESYLLDSGVLPVSGGAATYAYHPAALSQNFPNLESDGRGAGAAGSDVVTLTIAITGADANGNPAIQARTFTIFQDRIVSLESPGED